VRLALRQPALAELSNLGVVAVRGADAAQFLNSQLTVDVIALQAQHWQLGAYCSVKGRVLALFEMWRDDDGFRLLLPARTVRAVAHAACTLRAQIQSAAGWTPAASGSPSGSPVPGSKRRCRQSDCNARKRRGQAAVRTTEGGWCECRLRPALERA